VTSLRATRGQGRRELAPSTDPPFRLATAEDIADLEPLWRPSAARTSGPRPPALH